MNFIIVTYVASAEKVALESDEEINVYFVCSQKWVSKFVPICHAEKKLTSPLVGEQSSSVLERITYKHIGL